MCACATLLLLAISCDDEGDLETASWALDSDPTFTVVAPANFLYLDLVGEGSPVTMVYAVSGWTPFPGAGKEIRFYLDGQFAGAKVSGSSFTFAAVPMGLHTLTGQLFEDDEPVPLASAMTSRQVRVSTGCDNKADCEEGNPCSFEGCVFAGDGNYECHWGVVDQCCATLYDCPFGTAFCYDGDDDGIPECSQCLDSTQCDDGNNCSQDSCDNGQCVHTPKAQSCAEDSQCDDDNLCTSDWCEFQLCQCHHDVVAGCCQTDDDCGDDDVCSLDRCLGHECRHGPAYPGKQCCNDDGDCVATSTCEIAVCQAGDEAGFCSSLPDPAKPHCCLSDLECEGLSDKWIGKCTHAPDIGYHTCGYFLNPEWCETPAAGLIINELLADPTGVPDALGEWVELYNASDQPVDVTGYQLAGQDWELCNLFPSGGPLLQPAALLVVGRTLDTQLNGGVDAQFACGPDLSLENSTDTLQLVNPGGEIVDQVMYDPSFPLIPGASLSRKSPYLEAVQADNWSPGMAEFGSHGHKGTPGALNLDAGGVLSSPLCDDGDPCTMDVCSAESTHFCSHLTMGLCCTGAMACNDANACTNDQCSSNGQCAWTALPACCSDSGQCDDEDDCTIDSCINHVCRHGPSIPGKVCCEADSDCGASDPCKSGLCTDGFCEFVSLSDCCLAASQCSDGLKCTVDICLPDSHTCHNEPIPGCCESAEDCEQSKPAEYFCKTAWCIAGQCKYGPNAPACCALASHCDDDDECTWDMCNTEDNTCVHETKSACCNANSQCADDGDPCTLEICYKNACKSMPQDNCCLSDADCQDDNECTLESCLNNRCRTVSSGSAGCCFNDFQCPSDGLPCTQDKCHQQDCIHEVKAPCTLPLNFIQLFDSAQAIEETGFTPYYPGDQEGAPDWTVTTQGILGPDKHLAAHLLPGKRVCVSSPQLQPGADVVEITVGADLGVQTGDSTVVLYFLVRQVWAEAWAEQWTATFVKDTVIHKNFVLPTDGPVGTLYQAAFCAETQTSAAQVHLDSVAVAVGTPPEFSPFPPTIAIQKGATAKRTLRASDSDPESIVYGLTFYLASAPNWAVVGDYKYIPNMQLYQTRLTLSPPAKLKAGAVSFEARVSDGFLYASLPINVAVMDSGCLQDSDCWSANACYPGSCNLGKCSYSSVSPCCGNEVIEFTEQCDDGNGDSKDGCSAACTLEDNDWDGLFDSGDNCPAHSNPGQDDLDGDGVGDACDADQDGDAVPNSADNCALVPNGGQYDNEGDGLGDACDFDDDNDGVGDDQDLCPKLFDPAQDDNDGDGLGDVCDSDDDDDGIADENDNCTLVANPQQLDLDLDLMGNLCDPDADGDGHTPPWDCDDLDSEVYPRWVTASKAATEHWNWNRNVALLEDGIAYAASVEGETDAEFFVHRDGLERFTEDQKDYAVLGGAGSLAFALSLESVGDNMLVYWDQLPLPLAAGAVQADSFAIHGTRAVWVKGEGADSEVVLWKAGFVYQISDNTVVDSQPALSDEGIVWASGGEIVLYDGVFPLPLTDDNVLDEGPAMAPGYIAWTRRDGPAGKGNIVLFSLATGALTHIVDDAVEDSGVVASAFGVAWKRQNVQNGGVDVYFHDGVQTLALSSGVAAAIESLAIGEHVVVWVALSGAGREVWAWDGREATLLDSHLPPGTTLSVLGNRAAWAGAFGPVEARWVCTSVLDFDGDGQPGPSWGGDDCDDTDASVYPALQVVNLTQGSAVSPSQPRLHNGKVVWTSHDGTDREVFYFDGRGVIKLTANETPDLNPWIHANRVVWTSVGQESSQIWLFDGKSILPVAGSEGGDYAQVWGHQLAWLVKSDDGNRIWTRNLLTDVTTQLAQDPIWEHHFSLHGHQVAWATAQSDGDIRVHDLDTGVLASFGTFLVKDRDPVVFGGRTVWPGLATNWDLFQHDGVYQGLLAGGAQDQTAPAIWNHQTAWAENGEEGNRIIFVRSDASQEIIESPGLETSQMTMWGETLAWVVGSGEFAELVAQLEGQTIQVTDDAIEDRWPVAQAGEIAWLSGQDVMLLKTICGLDTDEDGFENALDNCPNLYNPNQVDLDDDGLGDTCDWDDDGDFVGDLPDNCQFTANLDQQNLDGDDNGDACDADADGDGFVSLPFGGDDCNDLDAAVFPVWNPQLVSGGTQQNGGPEISASTIAWHGKVGAHNQLFIYRGGSTLQLTDNLFEDTNPQVVGDRVVWEHEDGNDEEIWLWDGETIRQITDNQNSDRGPRLDEASVVWYGWDGNDYEVFSWQQDDVKQVTVNARNDYHPHVDGSLMVWRGFDGNDYEIFMKKGYSNFNISKNDTDDGIPVIEGKKVAWSHFDGEDYEIVLWDDEEVTQLTNNSVEDLDPSIDSGKVVWRRFDGHDYEIVMYTGVVVFQMTDDNMDKGPPKHHSGRVVWSARLQQTDDWEIYTYKAGKTVQVTVNNTQDVSPSVHGNTIVWRCNQGICMAAAECGQ